MPPQPYVQTIMLDTSQFKIIDITKELNNDKYCKENKVIFNPSIIKLEEPNKYLISYRYVGINSDEHSASKYHPWKNKDVNDRWGMDYAGTRFKLCKITKNTDDKTISVSSFKSIKINGSDHLDMAEDARLYITPNNSNKIIITYNLSFNDNNKYILQNLYKEEASCKNKCNLTKKGQKEFTLQLNNSVTCENCGFMVYSSGTFCNNNIVLENNTHLICPACISRPAEKNWTFWCGNDNKLRISYSIPGFHRYLTSDTNGLFISCTAHKAPDNQGYAGQLAYLETSSSASEYKNIQFSLSTPAIDFDNDHLLAVGHAKIDHENKTTSCAINKIISEIKDIKDKEKDKEKDKDYLHPTYMYFMYFYIINKINGQIDGISPLLLLDADEPYSLVFPTGLTKFDDTTYIVSYGVGDEMCKLAFFNKDLISDVISGQKEYLGKTLGDALRVFIIKEK